MRYEAMAAPANENAAEAGATINFGSISDGGFLLNLLQKGSRLEKDKDKNSHAKPSKQEQEQQQQQQNSDEVTNFHDPAVAALGPSHPLYQSQSQSQSSSHGSHSPWISARVSGFPNPATSTTIEQGLIAAGQGLENSSFLPFHANGVVPAPSPALTQNLQMAFPVPLNMGPASHMGFSVPHGFPMNMQQHPPTNMQSPFFADEKFGGAPTAFAVSGFPQQQPFNFTGGFGYQDHFPNSEPRRFEYNGYPESSVQTETGSAATSSVKGPTTVYQDNVRRDKLGKGPMTVHQENVGRDRSGKQVGAQQKGNKEVKNKDKVQGSFRLLKRPPSNEQVSNAGSAPTTTHSAKHGLQSGSRNRTNQAQEHLHACQSQHASVSVITENLDSVRLNEMDNGKALLQNHWESKAMHAMPMGLDRNQHKVALANGKHIGIVDRRQRQYQYREVGGYNRYTSKEGRVASRERNMAQGSAVDHNQQRKNWNTGSQVAEDADSTENQRNSQAIQKNDSQPRRVRVNETQSSSRQNYQEQVRRLRRRVFRYRDDIEVFTPRFLSIYESLTPGEDEETKRMELIFRLEKVIQRIWPQSELHLFGSCANSFGVSKSDIDVCLSIDEDESNKPKLVKKLAEILEAEDMKNVQALTRARVPIVKFTDPVTAISCDICINNILAVENTKLLHDYAQIDIRLQQLAFVVKHWAKSRQINETYQGTLSSYAYVLMCIHFLQQRKPAILPCLQKMEATYRVTVGKVECTYYDQVENLKDYGAQNRETLGQLLSAFFDYWAFRHDYASSVISVRTGGFLSKEFKNWTTRIGNERHLICIEDPFEIDHDLGRVVDKHSICVLRQEFLRAAEIMQQDPDPAATLFLPCDPRC